MKIMIETWKRGFVNLDYVVSIDPEKYELSKDPDLYSVVAVLNGEEAALKHNQKNIRYLFFGTREEVKVYMDYLERSIRKPNEARVISMPDSAENIARRLDNEDSN